jgi:predicted RNA-binding protein with PIN domain
MSERVLIVDGYNVLHAAERYRALLQEDIEAARAALVADVAAYAASASRSATVVFDGGGNPKSSGAPHHIAGLVVLFSPFGTDADTLIEGLARRSRDRGESAIVVTSDAATQWTVMGEGVTRMSAAEFTSALDVDRESWLEHTPSGSRKVTLDARLDAEVRDRLSQWARGDA